ncbi:cysteine-rich RLK (RECEPTOR-like protein kinase) 8, partial [Striga hermonthica]
IDYEETFSPVAMLKSIMILLALAAHMDYEIWQMDGKTALLNGNLDEDIYMQQPEGFIAKGQEHLVCKLKRSIYRLKQASRSWNIRFDEVVQSYGFTQFLDEHCVYKKSDGNVVVFLLLATCLLMFACASRQSPVAHSQRASSTRATLLVRPGFLAPHIHVVKTHDASLRAPRTPATHAHDLPASSRRSTLASCCPQHARLCPAPNDRARRASAAAPTPRPAC